MGHLKGGGAGYGPGVAERTRWGSRCIGCHKPIVYGDRCPRCQRITQIRAATRRRRR
jgi:rRNA maturation endonuclease Nob1